MKKSNFYLFIVSAFLLLLSSCSHTSQVNRVPHNELQYAQIVPEAGPQPEALAQADRLPSPALENMSVPVGKAPELRITQPKPTKKSLATRMVTKKVEKMYASAQSKITDNPIIAKAVKKKAEKMLSRNLKLAIILIVVGALIVWLLPWPISVIGFILEVVGVIFLLIWLLELLESA